MTKTYELIKGEEKQVFSSASKLIELIKKDYPNVRGCSYRSIQRKMLKEGDEMIITPDVKVVLKNSTRTPEQLKLSRQKNKRKENKKLKEQRNFKSIYVKGYEKYLEENKDKHKECFEYWKIQYKTRNYVRCKLCSCKFAKPESLLKHQKLQHGGRSK